MILTRFIWKKGNKIILFRYADQVLIGDELLVQGNNEMTPAKVINISSFMMQGEHLKFSLAKVSLIITADCPTILV